jgi:NADH-quinone oxidoreductase subunit D
MDIGAMTVFLYGMRERELVLDLFEEYCGARLTYNSMRIGGLPLDIPPGWDAKVRGFCDILDTKVDEYEELLTHNRIWRDRTRGVGVIPAAQAIAIGLSGPALRASGVARDIRKDEPYAAYADFEFDVPLGLAGDTYDRYLVRIEEFRQSARIIRQALDGLPEGPISSRPGVKSVGQVRVPKGEGYSRVEGARGEVGCYLVADGSAKPYRMKWRGASFSNLAVLPHILPGCKIADVVAIMGSVDPVFGEVDR